MRPSAARVVPSVVCAFRGACAVLPCHGRQALLRREPSVAGVNSIFWVVDLVCDLHDGGPPRKSFSGVFARVRMLLWLAAGVGGRHSTSAAAKAALGGGAIITPRKSERAREA